MIFGLASWVWISSLTRSIGAVAVLATAPATPPAQKSMRNCVMPPFSEGAGATNWPLPVAKFLLRARGAEGTAQTWGTAQLALLARAGLE